MALRKKIIGLIGAVIVSTSSISAWAACGTSDCWDIEGTWTCLVIMPDGKVGECTAEEPCVIQC